MKPYASGKALHAAVKKYAGEAAPIQRCQMHKLRNVLDHLSDNDKPTIASKLDAIYAMEDYSAAKTALDGMHRELMRLNPSAARSLGEGLEETRGAARTPFRSTIIRRQTVPWVVSARPL